MTKTEVIKFMPNQKSFRIFPWVIVGTSFISLALAYSIMYSFSVFFVALLKEFNWSRSLGAGAFSLFIITHGTISPFVGSLIDRFSPRNVFILGGILLGIGLTLCSFIHSSWEFYLFFGMLAAGGVGSIGWVPHTTLIQQWFIKNRGIAIGIISSGIGVGIFVCVPLIQLLIMKYGWRIAYRIIAFLIPLTVIFLSFLLSMKPSIETSPPSLNSIKNLPSKKYIHSHPWSAWEIIHMKTFQLLGLSFFLSNVVLHSILTHHVAFFVDQGLQVLWASYMVSLLGVVSIGGKILWGYLSDIIGRELTYTMGIFCAVCGILSLIFYSFYSTFYIPYLYALFFGLGYAVMASLPPLITADFFSGSNFGKVFGIIQFVNGLGSAFGAWFSGFIFDHFKSYIPVFLIMTCLVIFSCLNLWKVAPRKLKN